MLTLAEKRLFFKVSGHISMVTANLLFILHVQRNSVTARSLGGGCCVCRAEKEAEWEGSWHLPAVAASALSAR